jgi:hypothetical protein
VQALFLSELCNAPYLRSGTQWRVTFVLTVIECTHAPLENILSQTGLAKRKQTNSTIAIPRSALGKILGNQVDARVTGCPMTRLSSVWLLPQCIKAYATIALEVRILSSVTTTSTTSHSQARTSCAEAQGDVHS